MKIVGLVVFVLSTFFSIGQKSYYFSDPLPLKGKNDYEISKQYFGTYSSGNAARSYIVGPNGIVIVSTSISSINRATIRESSKYSVRDGYIFGVAEGDSLPCYLEGEYYYFGVRNRTLLVGPGTQNDLVKLSNGKYILNFAENGLYIPSVIEFSGNKMIVKEFDYELETTVFNDIVAKKEIPTDFGAMVILSPTKKEFDQLMVKNPFTSGKSFDKVKE